MGKIIKLNHITKIEGHASLNLGIEDGKVNVCELSSVEGSRYFEGIVRGRLYNEAHQITSRICGICSSAHVIAAISAIEDAVGYTPSIQTKELRVLLTLGERIRSHATHLYFLALPDYLGYESALAMAKKYQKELKRALELVKVGNKIIKVLASRDLHPVSATVGGWLKLPEQEELTELANQLKRAKKDAIETCNLFSSLTYPEFKSDSEWFSLIDEKEYAVLDGKFSSAKHSFDKKDYKKFLKEFKESRSTSNFVVKDDQRYMTGALARLNNNHEQLSKSAKELLKKSGLKLPSTNPYHNVIAQAIETLHCIDHAIKICTTLEIKPEPVHHIRVKAGRGVACIEVPRGTLWHEYTLDDKGIITDCNIITPTTQNLFNIQEDIREFVPSILDKEKKDMIMDIEKLIRAYDPCFSCSSHFLEVKWV